MLWKLLVFCILVLATLKIWDGRGRSPERQPGLNCELAEKVTRARHRDVANAAEEMTRSSFLSLQGTADPGWVKFLWKRLCRNWAGSSRLSVPDSGAANRASFVPWAPIKNPRWGEETSQRTRELLGPEGTSWRGKPLEGREDWGWLWAMGRTEEVWEISREFC